MKRYTNIIAVPAVVALLVFTAAIATSNRVASAASESTHVVSIRAGSSNPAAKRRPALQKFICKQGKVAVLINGADKLVKATGGCTFGGRPVGVWSWTRSAITDAAGTTCSIPSSPLLSGRGSSFVVVPAGRLTPNFTLVVKKTKKYPGKVMHVGGQPVVVGWDSCGTPLPVSSLPVDDPSPLCKYTGNGSFDAATRTLQLSGIGCPASFGPCQWQLDTPQYWHGIALGIEDYQGVISCKNGYFALPVAVLNSGCMRVEGAGTFVMPPSLGGGEIYWDLTIVTEGPDRQPLPVNVVHPDDPRWNGYTAYQRIGPYDLPGAKPICG